MGTTDGTTIYVEHPYKFRAGTDVPCWVQIDDEVLKVTAVDLDTGALSVERGVQGSVAATHELAVAVEPYTPTPTLSDASPSSGLLGKLRYADSTSSGLDLYATQIEIELENKCKAINGPFGTAIPQGFVSGEKREVNVRLGLYLTQDQAEQWGAAFSRADVEDVMLQIGVSAGSVLAACVPKLHLKPVDIGIEDAEEIVVTLEGRALCGSEGNDELILAFL